MIVTHRETKGIRLNAKTWGKTFDAQFLMPGVVSYMDTPDKEVNYLSQETIKRCAKSFVGKPLIIRHNRVNTENQEQHAGGYITDVYYNENDGWWWCKGIAYNEAAKQAAIKDGFVSCAYHIKATGPGGSRNNVRFHSEITDFDGEHLAIVSNPRYEGAAIRLNSKNKTSMNVFKWFKKDAPKENAGADAAAKAAAEAQAKAKENSLGGELPADTEIEIDGEAVKLNDLAALFVAEKAEAEKAKENAAPEVDGETEIEVAGEKVKLNDLIALHTKAKENAAKGSAKGSLKTTAIKIARENASSPITEGATKPQSMEDKLAKGRALLGVSKPAGFKKE